MPLKITPDIFESVVHQFGKILFGVLRRQIEAHQEIDELFVKSQFRYLLLGQFIALPEKNYVRIIHTMTKFDYSQWAKPEFAQNYREGADVFIIERRRQLEILKSFYNHYVANKPDKTVLDLGCGDGIVLHELLKTDNTIRGTLIDGSKDMISKAKELMKNYENLNFIQASFQDILNGTITLENYDFVVSSLAIHHLTMEQKTDLFNTIHIHLRDGGYFLNIDVILAPSNALEQWYLLLWTQWIAERKSFLGIKGSDYDDMISRYKDNTDNTPDTLDDQLKALQAVGFKDIDCFYKYGIFTMYGGRK